MSTELVEKKTIGEVEHIVHASGAWDGTEPVEFSNDGENFAETWMPTEEHPHPQFARVTVHRKDVKIPTRKTIRWDEQYPAASEEWSGKWNRSPMRHFGRTVRMVAFRETFRDLLGDIRIEEEIDERDIPTPPAAPEHPAERDWAAELVATETVAAHDDLVAEARRARVFTPTKEGVALDIAQKTHRRELVSGEWIPAAEAAELNITDGARETSAQIGKAEPRDHLPPQNRAARRKAARKKGGKR